MPLPFERAAADIDTFYLDIYSTQSLGDFVRLFASTVLGQLDSAPQKALSRISKFVRSSRPVFPFDELTGVPKVTIDVAPAEEENTLKEIFEYPLVRETVLCCHRRVPADC